jgi:hypothetical protein
VQTDRQQPFAFGGPIDVITEGQLYMPGGGGAADDAAAGASQPFSGRRGTGDAVSGAKWSLFGGRLAPQVDGPTNAPADGGADAVCLPGSGGRAPADEPVPGGRQQRSVYLERSLLRRTMGEVSR